MGWLDLAVGTFQLYGATRANLFSLTPSIVRSDWQSEVGFAKLATEIAEIPPERWANPETIPT